MTTNMDVYNRLKRRDHLIYIQTTCKIFCKLFNYIHTWIKEFLLCLCYEWY